jgi:hypothetical protein
MRAMVIFESLTGNTRSTAELIAGNLAAEGWETTVCSTKQVDLQALQQADVLIVGTWVDGMILIGQRPGGRGHLAKLPLLGGKPTYAYVTYAIDPGKTLDKLSVVLTERGADVRGAMTIRRDKNVQGAADFTDRMLAALEDPAPAEPVAQEPAVQS